jgi:flagellar biosynthesis protein
MTDKPPALAVALDYEKPAAPRVVAIGRGWLGEKIIEIAREHGVPLKDDPALAEALATVELDTEIPEELYRSVAAVIAFVLRTNAAAARRARGAPLANAPPMV